MYCRHCGKEIGTTVWCPYCGANQSDDGTQQNKKSDFYNAGGQNAWGEQIDLTTPAPKTNGFAIAGLILAFFSPLLGFIFSVIGLNKSREFQTGKGIAIAGMVVSAVNFIINMIATFTILPQLEQIITQLESSL